MRGRLVLTGVFVASAARAFPQDAPDPPPEPKPVETKPVEGEGGPGESCTNASDCRHGLRCVVETCRDPREGQSCSSTHDCGGELKCVQRTCTSLASMMRSTPAPVLTQDEAKVEDSEDWFGVELAGTRGFVGMSWGGGFAMPISTQGTPGINGTTTQASSFASTSRFALRAGALVNRMEVALEIAPMTHLVPLGQQCFSNFMFGTQCTSTSGPVFDVVGTVGWWLPLVQRKQFGVYWPMRMGVGVIATTGGRAFFQATADVIGVNVRVGHLFFGMQLPTFRYAFTPDDRGIPGTHVLAWSFNGNVGYVF